MVIFQRSLLREFGNYAFAVFSALFAIVITSQLVRLLGRAAGGQIPPDAVFALIGFTAINYLPILLALTLFVAVLMAISRAYRDSEMVVWSTSGVALTAWIRPVLVFAMPIILLITLMALFLSPWANGRAEEYRRQLDSRDELSRVAPGVFRESANAERVFFVEAVDGKVGEVRNVFVATKQHGKNGVVVSDRGYMEVTPNGDRFAVLLEGRRYEGTPGTPEYSVTDFERYAVRVQSGEQQSGAQPSKTIPTVELIRRSDNKLRGELMWRIGLPFIALNLALLAIPLAFVNPRASRSINLLFAVFAYMLYSNLVGVVQAWVGQGKVSFDIGWWIVHAAAAAVVALLFVWRSTQGFAFLRWR
ncbi:MAG TPA: LPS export ABC transporter permease LptF [Burkholderiales bacterium]|nr:LPS export ABC transporter permease LptF [Burkholderiales bacterium]